MLNSWFPKTIKLRNIDDEENLSENGELEVLVGVVDDGEEHVDEDKVDEEDEGEEVHGAKYLATVLT